MTIEDKKVSGIQVSFFTVEGIGIYQVFSCEKLEFSNTSQIIFQSKEAMEEKNKENEDGDDELIEETVTSEGLQILSLKLLPLVRNLQSKHGLRHGDYQRYRGYCSRRLARLRKVLKLVQVGNL